MKKILMLILDGFGLNENENGNVFKMAKTPVIDSLMQEQSYARLKASGENVGFAKETPSNAQNSYYLLGSGRDMLYEYNYVNKHIRNKKFFSNEIITDLIKNAKNNNKVLHLVGLVSSCNIHSSVNNYFAVLAMCKAMGFSNVYLHLFTDGIDYKDDGALKLLSGIENKLKKLEIGKIGSLCGRYYAMDNDQNADRIKKCYDSLCYGIGNNFSSTVSCIKAHYKSNLGDAYINPSIIDVNSTIKDGDSVLFMNYRKNDISLLLNAFTNPSFDKFNTNKYQELKVSTLFNTIDSVTSVYDFKETSNSIGQYLSSLGFKQARIGESFRFKDLTFYFDGENVIKDKNYENFFVNKNINNEELKPELNIAPITQKLMNMMEDDYDFIVCSLSNADVFSTSSNVQKIIDSTEIVDFCVGKIIEKAKEQFYEVVITSPYGSIEEMIDKKGITNYKHTTNDVPFIIANSENKIGSEGTLKDVAPTIINMFDIKIPDEMQGKSLIIKEE